MYSKVSSYWENAERREFLGSNIPLLPQTPGCRLWWTLPLAKQVAAIGDTQSQSQLRSSHSSPPAGVLLLSCLGTKHLFPQKTHVLSLSEEAEDRHRWQISDMSFRA